MSMERARSKASEETLKRPHSAESRKEGSIPLLARLPRYRRVEDTSDIVTVCMDSAWVSQVGGKPKSVGEEDLAQRTGCDSKPEGFGKSFNWNSCGRKGLGGLRVLEILEWESRRWLGTMKEVVEKA